MHTCIHVNTFLDHLALRLAFMDTCIQNNARMPANTEFRVISLSLNAEEQERYQKVLDIAKDRHAYINKTHVIRELIGISDPAILTAKEIEYFRKGTPITNKRQTVPILKEKAR